MSIGRALNCKMRIQQFCENHNPKHGEGIENDRLKPQHWRLLEKLHDTLGAFYETTLCGEGNNNTLGDWFYSLDYLLDSINSSKIEFEEHADKYPKSEEYTFLQASAAAAWAKTEEYYGPCNHEVLCLLTFSNFPHLPPLALSFSLMLHWKTGSHK